MKRKAHGHYHTPEYKIWAAMLQRCTNPNDKRWNRYGGRGITVCDDWRLFVNFHRDMGPRPDGLTLDRIDNDAGYNKENCRWTDRTTQAYNRSIFKCNSTGYKCIQKRKDRDSYRVVVSVGGKLKTLGHTKELADAVALRDSFLTANSPHKVAA